eukprot:contig_24133_g5939
MAPHLSPNPIHDTEVCDMSDGSADVVHAAIFVAQQSLKRRRHFIALWGAIERRRWRGSLPGRRQNRARDFDVGFHSLQRDYFGVDGRPPVYGEADFETRFRVPRNVFMHVYNDEKDLPYWKR